MAGSSRAVSCSKESTKFTNTVSVNNKFIGIPATYIYIGGFAGFTAIFLKNAWVAEDAYILFRSIEQLFVGNGPVWNPHERVQVFTSPLWYCFLSFIRIFSQDCYLNAIALSLILCLSTLYLLKLIVNDAFKWLCILLFLVSSKGFFDFTSSGIENALGYFLITAFLLYSVKLERDQKIGTSINFGPLMLCAGLLATCRHDLLTLVLPTILLACWEHCDTKKNILLLLVGFVPFIAWSLFSIFYYGFPFPNTAYAKLSTGIPRSELWIQGGKFLLSSFRHDPVTPCVIAVATVALFMMKKRYAISFAFGIALNLLYVVNVGGDFMQGRFLSFAYILSLCAVFAYTQISGKFLATIMLVICIYFFAFPDNPVVTTNEYSKTFEEAVDMYGIADERGYYFKDTSFWSYLNRDKNEPFPSHDWSKAGLHHSASERPLIVFGNIGFMGYWSGTNKIVVDNFALADPFLSRLPAIIPWRIGHFERKLPDGYLESIFSGSNCISDSKLRLLYNEIRLITQGPLWSAERMRAIIHANFGSRSDFQN